VETTFQALIEAIKIETFETYYESSSFFYASIVAKVFTCLSITWALKHNSIASSNSEFSDDEIRKQLVDSWRIVSASFGGVPSELHKNSITIKHITPVHIIWIGYQPDDRKIFRSAGGSWKVDSGKYIETMRYGLDPKFKDTTFGKDFVFECRFEGDLWIQTGKLSDGSEMIETWQRIKPDEDVSTCPADLKP
jgi:hypothetical protein